MKVLIELTQKWVDGLEPAIGEKYVLERISGGKSEQVWSPLSDNDTKPIIEKTIYPTSTAVVTVAGNPPINSLSGSIIAEIGDSIVVTTSLVGGVLITYPGGILRLPVVRYSNNLATDDEIYFTGTIIDGVLSAKGSFPRSGNWKIGIERTNKSISRIAADWEVSGRDIGFIV